MPSASPISTHTYTMGSSALPRPVQDATSSQLQRRSKRKNSLSTQKDRASKRVVSKLSLDPPPPPPLLPTTNTQLISHCRVCGRHCWFCQATSASAQETALPARLESSEESSDKSSEGSMLRETSGTATQGVFSRASTRKRIRQDGRIFVGPKDKGFEEKILVPCKVKTRHIIPPEGIDPAVIFGKQSEIASTHAWMALDDAALQRTARIFAHYERKTENENTLGTICNQEILVKGEWPDPEDPVRISSVRKDSWRPHQPGPVVESDLYCFDWDVEPDVTYTVSINQFDLELRTRLHCDRLRGWLAENEASCPYLTIEYKCGEKGGKKSDALHQNICASVIWLHQRRQMRQELGIDDLADLRHYSMILLDSRFEIWEARCGPDGEGYSIRLLTTGLLVTVPDLQRYIDWSNAIHTWGLGANASSFKADIIELLNRWDQRPLLTATALEAAVSSLAPTPTPAQIPPAETAATAAAATAATLASAASAPGQVANEPPSMRARSLRKRVQRTR